MVRFLIEPMAKYMFIGSRCGVVSSYDLNVVGNEGKISLISNYQILGDVSSLAYKSDKRQLLIGNSTGVFYIVNILTGDITFGCKLHDDAIVSQHLYKTKGFLVTSSRDKSAKIWKLPES